VIPDVRFYPISRRSLELRFSHVIPAPPVRCDEAATAWSIIELAATLPMDAPQHLKSFYQLGVKHNEIVRNVIERFGRHPHRNSILGRLSTPEEETYIATGDFPHQKPLPEDFQNNNEDT
jgi:hypothetical protein